MLRFDQHGVFVTGTDTGIGKTMVSACLVRAWDARYWKPVQTGLADEPGDTETVAWLASAKPERLHAPRWSLRAPLSPEAAGRREGVRVALDDFILPQGSGPVVVEGAGGVLVPLNERETMLDLMARLGLPAVVVARSALGTINHTLLSLQALRSRGIAVHGVVMVGDRNEDNEQDVARHGGVAILAALPKVPSVTPACIESWSRLFKRPFAHQE
jgi:malonyl-CoA O-methyltransferase